MYQVLYRKWRPQVFSDVVGQDHITKTLMGAVESGRVSHAYLFTGSRGTGKTSCAKILAKAVNCEHPVNGNPCNECASCRGIDNGSIVDVVEIDAASNNGVDNIRDLREETNYMPSSVKYRVYIIDEVHMLSTGAFNALLKTLEEPPEHVKFILATTEVHKLPATILSRCQRFDFKRIPAEDIKNRLKFVAEKENLNITDEAALLIARVADGGMRDALSLLDRCASYGTEINEELVSQASGIAGKEHIYALTDAINGHNCEKALNLINDLYQNSCDMERLLNELMSHFRNMMVALSVSDYQSLILTSETDANKIKAQAQNMTLEAILFAMDVINDAISQLKRGVNKRIAAEMAVIRLTSPQLEGDIPAILRRISELERKIENGKKKKKTEIKAVSEEVINKSDKAESSEKTEFVASTSVQPEQIESTVEDVSVTPAPLPVAEQQTAEIKNTAERSSASAPFTKWAEVLELVGETDRILVSFLTNSSAYTENERLFIKGANPVIENFLSKKEHYDTLENAVYELSGNHYRISTGKKTTEESQTNSVETVTDSANPLEALLQKAKQLNIDILEQ